MIDHVSVGVSDLERSARFYEATLAPLGLVAPGDAAGDDRFRQEPIRSSGSICAPAWRRSQPESGVHICLRAKSTDEVDAFHAAALKAGGRSDGAPGLRPHDRVRYYAAFVIDPDGNRIEAVTFPNERSVSERYKPCAPRSGASSLVPVGRAGGGGAQPRQDILDPFGLENIDAAASGG